jgi:malate dehydrogenase (oxaloacetate-decarboxylating)(NADP+)
VLGIGEWEQKMSNDFKEESLHYHRWPTPGKISVEPTKPLANKVDLARAYSPGVAHACNLIVENPAEVANMTSRGNLVAVISNGTAVLGLGNIGPLASKPVMEGKGVLFKKFANIDVFDIEINENDPKKLIDIIASLEPTFGGINLEDIKAPECFEVEKELRKRMKIPVFHDDQHGTAIVTAAATYNALRIVNKDIKDVKLVASGGGAASIACIDLIVSMGLPKEHVSVCDSKGLIYKGRTAGMNEYKEKYARDTDMRTLDEVIDGADIFFGLSGPGVLTQDMVKKMADKPIILAMANPTPEILPELVREVRPDAIIATGRSDYPNQVNNVLCFPFLFRGALDCGASTINEAMKLACMKAIADLTMKEANDVVAQAYAGEELKFGPEYLIPKPFDPRLIVELPVAVVKAAMESGVATRPIEDLAAYKKKLETTFVRRSGLFMQPVIDKIKDNSARLVYPEGENIDVLRAVQSVVDEKIARPILIGRPSVIREQIDKMGLRLKENEDFQLFDPMGGEHEEDYWQQYHAMVGRHGVSVEAAKNIMHTNSTVLAAMMVKRGQADGMICGKVGRYESHFSDILDVIGKSKNYRMVSSLCTVLLPSGPLFLADSFLNIDPTADQIVEIARSSVEMVRKFGVEPKVALLSHSNFGSSRAPSALKMRKAAAMLRERMPDVELDGEMHAMSAMNPLMRSNAFQNSTLEGKANLLIMPSLDAANIALGLIRSVTNALLIGPLLAGLDKPAHVVIPSVTGRGIFNMSAFTAADINKTKEGSS